MTVERDASGADEVYVHAGGQGVWVARIIEALGHDAVLCGPFGGETGGMVKHLVEAEGIEIRSTKTRGANGSYVHDRRAGHRREVAEVKAPGLDRHETDDLFGDAFLAGMDCGHLVITGPMHEQHLAPELFARLASDLSKNGVRVTADVSGATLAALDGGIDFLKVSHEELIAGGYSADESESSLIEGLRALAPKARNVVVSRADKGVLALIDGKLVRAHGPAVSPRDPSGAGDSMTGALACGAAEERGAEAALSLGLAAGAMNATRLGRGSGSNEHIREFARHIRIEGLYDG
ncbi:MAG: PfkB family carbohydrate kinase [Steroidobacteraceae bacterium]